MNKSIERIMAGELFVTGGGLARVRDRQPAGLNSQGDALLLEVTTSGCTSFKAWTTILALEDAIASGAWGLSADAQYAA